MAKKTLSAVVLLGSVAFAAAAQAQSFGALRTMLKDPAQAEAAVDGLKELGLTGDSRALQAVGDAYANGLGVAQSDDQAIIWYSRAAREGNAAAAGRAGLIIQSNTVAPEALRLWRMGVDGGDVLSMNQLSNYEPKYVVRSIQSALNAKGFDAGTPDGVPGPRTWGAVRAFCAANDLTCETGEFDGKLLRTIARPLYAE